MEERYVLNQEARLWTCSQGNGPPMLLCSGGPGSADYLGPVASMVDDLVFTIRCEQRGCGRSSREGPYDLKTTLSDLESVRKSYGIDGWIVAGHSWGANLALAYAMEHAVATRGLVYVCGNGAQHDVDWREQYKSARAAQGEKAPETGFPGNDEVNREGNRAWYDYIKKPDFFRRIAGIRVPTLFVHGTRDVRPVWPAQQLAALIRSSADASISGAAHYIWLTHGDELRSVLRNFIKQTLSQSG
ncbi:alpha/beta fold hydrolase [Candidatus Eisenbacteria bacterium]|uniref:Alpha/beta fold hydrolase n=1 Tax=Eiseniibacteriota bacterium TaxID=2212470 RepID=A0ABV6YMV5_UNCEI